MSKPWENKPWEANANSWKNPEYKKNNEAWKNPPYKAMNATWQDKWGTKTPITKKGKMVPGMYFEYLDIQILGLMELVFKYAGLNLITEQVGSSVYFRKVEESVLEKDLTRPMSTKLRQLLKNAILGNTLDSEHEFKSSYIFRFRNDIPGGVFAAYNFGISEKLCIQMHNIVLAISSQSKGDYKIPEYILVCWIAHEIAEQMYYIEKSGQLITELYSGESPISFIQEEAHKEAIEYVSQIFQELSGYENASLPQAYEDRTPYTKVFTITIGELQELNPQTLTDFNFVIGDFKLFDPKSIVSIRSLQQTFGIARSDKQTLVFSWWTVTNELIQGFSHYNLTSFASHKTFKGHQGIYIE